MDSFVDLGDSGESGTNHEGFWPSFTDIMTVVLMIFMMASTVLVLRNWHLMEDLRASIEAERTAAEVARAVAEANANLGDQLSTSQEQLTQLRMELLRAREEAARQAQLVTARDRSVAALTSERERLTADLSGARRQSEQLDEQLRRTGGELAGLKEAYAAQEGRLANTRTQLDESQRTVQLQEGELNRLRQAASANSAQLASLQGEYDSLKVKYDKLVRPARSPAGKQVVEVRYEKAAAGYRIALREPGQSEFRELSREQLEGRLVELRRPDPARLYVKIVIPDNSGLSYTEAWSFTRDILNGYDYYYVNRPATE